MTREIVIAGFGGQGVMSMGRILAQAGMKKGWNVSWVPSYGPEMRGGTANCTVVLSDEPIASPVVASPGELIAMNGPSLERFMPAVTPGGLILVNSSVAGEAALRQDVRGFHISCTREAIRLGNPQAANMVMLGAYIRIAGLMDVNEIRSVLVRVFSKDKAALAELNERALIAGFSFPG